MIFHVQLKSFPVDDKDPFITHNQYNYLRWPGDAKRQGIGNHGIDLVTSEYFFLIP